METIDGERGRISRQSIKDHPFYPRICRVAPEVAASWVLGELPVERAEKPARR